MNNAPTPTQVDDCVAAIADAILDDLSDRSGVLDGIRPGDLAEMVQTHVQIIKSNLEQLLTAGERT